MRLFIDGMPFVQLSLWRTLFNEPMILIWHNIVMHIQGRQQTIGFDYVGLSELDRLS